MKYLAILFLVLSGCASAPSDYNQGCRDGVDATVSGQFNLTPSKSGIEKFCNELEESKKDAKSVTDGSNRPGGRSSK